ncbi:acyl-CoA Delta(11) desaturase-like isoform X2 [Zootermopsis nevadensis]|uniref:Acyl-CoA Delta(11) desaturase n=1 Tax=Zootermopsis nevadensis TaxID=136037 RepID=A0A067R1V5_ZOONE|nr:acyl-CoA Delta(11) desaturase-like isoform X2 [Zootermopsis nevadensis]KDR15981.1 Acyl-CoA Delta(11) desaturase [Zootermopsis nevadensis]
MQHITAADAMAPNSSSVTEDRGAGDTAHAPQNERRGAGAEPYPNYRTEVVWPNVVVHAYLNLAALYGAYLMFTSARLPTAIWAFILYEAGILGITAGAHRLWSHRAYKATWPLRVFLVLLQTLAFQTSAHEWVRNHRVHHKFSDTDADPHNVNRGFFFTHYGWMLTKKHPAVKENGKKVDSSDLDADPLLIFQKRYYMIIMPILCFVIPTAVPVFVWNETWSNAYHIAAVMRQVITLHMTLITNSVTHWPDTWRKRPYDKRICPSENFFVSLLTLGEGWHNFHHVFPWDYKTSEIGYNRINPTTHFIDFCARIGLAYDLKTVPTSMVKRRVQRTGDGTHELWGWGDADMSEAEKKMVQVVNEKAT